MKVFRESRSHSVVRETKKQDRNPEDLISKERGTEVKIKDEQQNIMKRQCRILRVLLNTTQVWESQMKFRYSIGFFILQCNSWTSWEFDFSIRRYNLGRRFGFKRLEKKVWRIQGAFVGDQDRKRTILYIAKNGGVRGHSWIRETLSDAWQSMTFGSLVWRLWAYDD